MIANANALTEEELGAAISLEDALSIMVVIFVLFLILFVPLIQLDKVNLEKSERATFWSKIYSVVHKKEIGADAKAKLNRYNEAFYDLTDKKSSFTRVNQNLLIIESIDDDDNVTVILHNPVQKEYVMLISQEFSDELIYRHGNIQSDKGVYFTSADEVDYGSNPRVIAMQKKYVEWVKETRNIVKRKIKITGEKENI